MAQALDAQAVSNSYIQNIYTYISAFYFNATDLASFSVIATHSVSDICIALNYSLTFSKESGEHINQSQNENIYDGKI